MALRPTPFNVLVKLKKVETTLPNGLVLSEAHQKPNVYAIVVALPNEGAPEGVEVADTVLLSSEYAGATFTHEGADYTVVTVEEILAVTA